jgi:Tfp pilus assembly protein PilV
MNLVEVCAALLVLALGFTALIGLIHYGIRLSAEAQARTTGYATALTVLADSRALEFAGNAAGSTSGQINGYWAVRTRTPDAASFTHAQQAGATIVVQVFDGMDGGLIAELRDHVVEQQ